MQQHGSWRPIKLMDRAPYITIIYVTRERGYNPPDLNIPAWKLPTFGCDSTLGDLADHLCEELQEWADVYEKYTMGVYEKKSDTSDCEDEGDIKWPDNGHDSDFDSDAGVGDDDEDRDFMCGSTIHASPSSEEAIGHEAAEAGKIR